MKHSSAILNTHFGLSKKIRFFASILEIGPIRYLHRLLKTVCENWIDLVTLWWEYRFERVFSTTPFTTYVHDETGKRVMDESTVSRINIWIYESVILYYIAYCIIRKYRLVIP